MSSRRVVLIVGLVAALVTSLLAWRGNESAPAEIAPIIGPNSVIDRPALDRVAPEDAVVNVMDYGATGDGRTDDTDAIQSAISDNLGFANASDKILYFPAGTYLVSRPLEWRLADGSWSTWLTLMGQNRDRTVVKLADSAPEFGDPQDPRAVVVTGSQNAAGPDGSGNQAHHNFIFDMTVDVGAGNPGADGIDFMANNRGAIRNVVLRADPGSGHSGIAMNRNWPGPALLEDIRVTGFERGISVARSEYSITAEDIRLSGQRTVGVDNQNNVLSIRRLVSDNVVPAVRNGGRDNTYGLLTLLESDLTGGGPDAVAIENFADAFLRDVRSSGYAAPLRHRGNLQYPADDGEWSSAAASTLFDTAASSLRLPIAEEPVTPDFPSDQWAGVGSFGALVDDDVDDTAAIQAALDSGKPVVYLRSGRYEVTDTLSVPSTVQAIVGFEAQFFPERGVFSGPGTAAVFSIRESSTDPLIISQVLFEAEPNVVDFERAAARPLVLRDINFGGLPFRGAPGPLFLTNVEAGDGWEFTAGQQVWARQLNVERSGTMIRNTGGDLWVLGLKTESPATVVVGAGGARTEVLGALLYPTAVVPATTPAFSSVDSSLSLTVATTAYEQARNYPVMVDAVRDGKRRQLLADDVEPRSLGSTIPLYSDR